ncbi:MAG: tetratricopeptide repeat protein [Deltaproteobacteria bacterium]|nr:tetratricopeptide repeat protein [Deltaproteobacteria bacterium]
MYIILNLFKITLFRLLLCLTILFQAGCSIYKTNIYSPTPVATVPLQKDSITNYGTTIKMITEGQKMLKQGNFEKALDIFEEAYTIDSANPWTAFYLSKTWAAKGDYTAAIEFAKRAQWLFSGNTEGKAMAMRQEAYCLEGLGTD